MTLLHLLVTFGKMIVVESFASFTQTGTLLILKDTIQAAHPNPGR